MKRTHRLASIFFTLSWSISSCALLGLKHERDVGNAIYEGRLLCSCPPSGNATRGTFFFTSIAFGPVITPFLPRGKEQQNEGPILGGAKRCRVNASTSTQPFPQVIFSGSNNSRERKTTLEESATTLWSALRPKLSRLLRSDNWQTPRLISSGGVKQLKYSSRWPP